MDKACQPEGSRNICFGSVVVQDNDQALFSNRNSQSSWWDHGLWTRLVNRNVSTWWQRWFRTWRHLDTNSWRKSWSDAWAHHGWPDLEYCAHSRWQSHR